MTVIHVPRPPKTARNLQRPVNALLLAQARHLHEAEQALPPGYRSGIYIRAIRTEGEAAAYIREVTEAIHQAHADAEAARQKPARPGRRGPALAGVAEPSAKRKKNAKRGAKDSTPR